MLTRSTAAPGAGRAGWSPDGSAAVALLLGLAGLGYRLALLLTSVPGSNSDEATFGLAAMHIAAGERLPIFMYGQRYMGTVESYLAAPLFAAAGPSWLALRLPLLLLWAVFVLLVYRLSRRIFSPWLATFTVGLLALGSERVIRDQLTAVGGRPEVKPAIVLLLLLALGLGERRIRHRWPAYALFGLLAGLVLWDDWLALPYLGVAALALLVATGRDLAGRAGLLVATGFAVGVLPLILDNLRAPPGQDSWSVLRELSHGVSEPASLGQRLHGTVEVGIPLASGLCPPDRCVPTQVWWGLAYGPLLVAAAVLALLDLRRRGAAGRSTAAVRLALVAGAALTLLAYVRNDLAGTAPVDTARYLSMVQISLPAVLWPLWLGATRLRGLAAAPDRAAAGLLPAAALAALVAAMLWGSTDLVRRAGTMRSEERQARALATAVRQAGIRYVYAEYWTCNRLVFNAREQVVCAVLRPDLRPGQNRHPRYAQQVGAAASPAYLFTADGRADGAFREHLRRRQVAATVTAVGPYRIYRPATTVRPWR